MSAPRTNEAILSALEKWVNDGADGFRFDLMGTMPIATLANWQTQLDSMYQANHQSHLLFYGEPWGGGGQIPNGASKNNIDSQVPGMIGAFFDNFRDGVRGTDTGSSHDANGYIMALVKMMSNREWLESCKMFLM